jgi:hypothetical protein
MKDIQALRAWEVWEEPDTPARPVFLSILRIKLEGKVEMAGMAVAVEEETPEEEGGLHTQFLVPLFSATCKATTRLGSADCTSR